MREALNKLELERLHSNPAFNQAFVELFAISEFYRACIPRPDFAAAETFAVAVKPTPCGEGRLDILTTKLKLSDADARLALLLSPSHSEIEIDVMRTDYESLWDQLSADIIGQRIQFPWVYGRLLYDRFFELFPSRTRTLSDSETAKLIDGCPHGVFQIGSRLIGPFGVLISSELRYLYPATTAPLWHCSDPACTAIHPVKFSAPQIQAALGVRALSSLRQTEGPSSEWFGFYRQKADPYAWYDHMYPSTLPWLVANAFSQNEQKEIFIELISSTDIRERLPQTKRFKGIVAGSAAQIGSRMGPDLLLQALLLATDMQLAKAIEDVISTSRILIPATEVRYAPIQYARRGWFDCSAECSHLGVRFRSSRSGFAIRNLRAVVADVYSSGEGQEELAWKVRQYRGESTLDRLDCYLRESEPTFIVRDLFLDSLPHLKRLFEALRFGSFALPTSAADEHTLIAKVVWKLGFKAQVYPKAHERLGLHLQAMRAVLGADAGQHIDVRDRIRSAGVNLFVALEEILDYSLALAGWTLLADHYSGRRFTFGLDQGQAFVAETLNRSCANTTSVVFDREGKNTLYALVVGFDLLAREIRGRLNRGNEFLRVHDMPGHNGTTVDPFPLQHTCSVFDIERSDVMAALEIMASVTRELTSANVMSIRNRLDHQRKDFPTAAELIAVCKEIERIVTGLETSGLFSPPCIDVGARQDEYGRGVVLYRDYIGRTRSLPTPSYYRILPTSPGPMILLFGLRFTGSSEIVRLRLRETSTFEALWDGYPRRRPRARVEDIEEHDNSETPSAPPA